MEKAVCRRVGAFFRVTQPAIYSVSAEKCHITKKKQKKFVQTVDIGYFFVLYYISCPAGRGGDSGAHWQRNIERLIEEVRVFPGRGYREQKRINTHKKQQSTKF